MKTASAIYDWGAIHPAKTFVYWAFRRLRRIPNEWQPYYRDLLLNEMRASSFKATNFEVFCLITDAYRKAKWVLKKYGCEIDENTIPEHYNNFWENSTYEERIYAFHRSHEIKTQQALHRGHDDCADVPMAYTPENAHEARCSFNSICEGGAGRSNRGYIQTAQDLPAPRESDIKFSEESNDMTMEYIAANEEWNPLAQQHKKELEDRQNGVREDMMAFEDEDGPPLAAPSPKRR